MPEQMPFINREPELAQIHALIKTWEATHVALIDGVGGIGKTRLLDEIEKRFADTGEKPILMVGTIDFDDLTYQLPENVEQRIAQRLDEHAFEPYLRALRDWRKMEAAGVSSETLDEHGKHTLDSWVQSFNQVAAGRRIILRFDTSEKAENEVWARLCALIASVNNTLFIIAGRNAEALQASLAALEVNTSIFIPLKPFDNAAGEKYLAEKQRSLHVTLEPEMTQKLLFLAGGKPILIDLAVEWLSRNVPFEWITNSTFKAIQALSPSELQKRRKQFEGEVVLPIAQIRNAVDRLTLAMSHVYPLSPPLIAQLLDITISEANQLFDEATTYVFVKQVAKDRISLHDVMRDLINAHVWSEVDDSGDRRRLYSRIATQFFRLETSRLIQRIDLLVTIQEDASLTGDTQIELNAFIERETRERELWMLREQLLFHGFFVNIPEGIETFCQVFDEAVRVNQSSMQRLFLNQAQQFQAEFTSSETYEVEIRRAIHWLNVRRTTDAKLQLDRLMSEYADGGRRELNILTRLANHAQLTGDLPGAVKYLEQALDICHTDPAILKVWGGIILNGLGWMNRLMGKWHQSAEFYRQGIALISEAGNEAGLAAAYNNLGYVDGLQKNYDSALVYCKKALRMQEELHLRYESGRTHNTLGIVYRGKHDYLISLKHTEQALAIFIEFDDKVWTARAYCERGITRWHMGDLVEADQDLDLSYAIAHKMGIDSELVNIWHGKGHVAWEQGRLEEAEQFFANSAELGRRVSDPRQTVNSLEGLVELYYDMGYAYHQIGEYAIRDAWYAKSTQTAEQWKAEFEDKGYDFPLYSGDRIRTMANIAYDHDDFEIALEDYLHAYLRTATPWGYSRQTLPERLNWLQERIDQLPAQTALSWCDRIQQLWEQKGLAGTYPEMITICEVGRDNAKRRAANRRVGAN